MDLVVRHSLMIRFRTIILLCLTVLAVAANQAVLLRDVTSITLYRGQQTTGRRSSPVPQLQCVGGTAAGKFSPKVVQCYNRGFDGRNPQWECTSELPLDYQFGKISVSCEGYEFPEDPYILAGSCGLKYELDYSTSGARKGAYSTTGKEGTNYMSIIYFVGIAFVLYLLYLSFTSTREGHEGDRGTHYPGDGPGDDHPPYPPGWRQNYQQPPPSYDETFKGTSRGNSGSSGATGSTGSSNFGFFSGLGLGGLGGYLLGNNWGRGNNHRDGTAYRRRGPTQFERDTGFYSDSYNQPGPSHHYDSPSSSGSTHTSSGFGGTERR